MIMDGASSKMKNHEHGVIFWKDEKDAFERNNKIYFWIFFQIALTRGSFLLAIVSQKLHSLRSHAL